jgi:hypothetical protein
MYKISFFFKKNKIPFKKQKIRTQLLKQLIFFDFNKKYYFFGNYLEIVSHLDLHKYLLEEQI